MFLMFLMLLISISATAQLPPDITVTVKVIIDGRYVNGLKEWVACVQSSKGRTGNILATCNASEVTDADLRARIDSWLQERIKRDTRRSLLWLEGTRPSLLPADHVADLTAKESTQTSIEAKRERILK